MKLTLDTRTLITALALLGLVWATPGSAEAEEKLDKGAAARGETIYKRYCVSCHGPSGKGDGPLAEHLRQSVPDIRDLTQKNKGVFPFEKIVRIVDGRDTARAHGTPDMPAWGDAFQKTTGTESKSVDEAISRLTHYIWSLQKPAKK